MSDPPIANANETRGDPPSDKPAVQQRAQSKKTVQQQGEAAHKAQAVNASAYGGDVKR